MYIASPTVIKRPQALRGFPLVAVGGACKGNAVLSGYNYTATNMLDNRTNATHFWITRQLICMNPTGLCRIAKIPYYNYT